MKIKTLLIVSLLFGLWAGSANAQSPVSLPHTQNFDDNQMHGWRFDPEGWVNGYGIPMSVLDVAGDDAYLNHGEQDGYSFYFGSDSPSYQDSYLISPELAGTENGIHLSFYYSNIFQGATTFQVGYSTFTDDLEDFVWGAVITASESDYWENNSATWMQKEMDFPRNVKYIAFSMTRNQSSTLCIDDIVIASANCALPALFQVTGTTSNSITLSWQDYGESYSYDIRYSNPNTMFYNFNEGLEPWTSFGNGGSVDTWFCDDEMEGHNGTRCAYSTLTIDDAEEVYFDYDNYLVSPLMNLSGSVSFYAMAGSLWSKAEFAGTQFEVMVYPGSSISEADSASFVKIGEGTISDDWEEFDFTISGYDGQQGYLIIRHINDIDDETWDLSYLLIDDVTISGGDWTTQNTTNANYTIEGLSPETTCFVKIRGNNGTYQSTWTDLLEVKTFPTTAPSSYEFKTAGDWNVPNNWKNSYMPQNVTDNVTVKAAAVIPEGCVAKGTITMNNGSITIKDGGQLVHNNASGNISVTAKKRIWAYPAEGKAGYYLIASPIVATTAPANVVNMTDNNYDLYSFDQNEEDEWQNYEEHGFSLSPKQGYLYANSGKVTLKFTGAINPSNNNITVNNLGYTEGAEFKGWNLVGNPFMCNAYLTDGQRDFYVLNENGSEVVMATERAIAPLQGVFVKATSGSDEITFSKEVAQSKGSVLNVNVIRKEANVDVARVRFGEGEGLEKFQLNPNHTKVYFPQNGKNYAVVNAGSVDELPFSFEAENDDTFTLSFTQEQVEFSYLHLIDNLTGANIDLLQQPEYTFESKVSDYPSRFKVVFVAKDAEGAIESSEAFAFNSNGEFVIVNEGQATLQVIDLQGRMISSETIEGCVNKSVQVAPGVYVLRLINGENIRVQKVVIR